MNDLEKSFSCSYWSGDRKNPDEVIDQYLKIQKKCFEQNLQKIPHKLNIVYDGEQKLDLWGGNGIETLKIFSFVHGGYWQEGSKDLATTMVGPLTENGISTAIIGYNLAPTKTIFEIVEQIGKAFKFLSLEYPKAKLFVGGHSAGAHLVAKAIELFGNVNKISKIVLICAIFHLEELVETYIGKSIGLTEEMAQKCNVNFEKFISQCNMSKILIMLAENDAPKISEQNEKFVLEISSPDLLKLKKISGVNHFSIIEGLQNSNENQTKILLDFLKNC